MIKNLINFFTSEYPWLYSNKRFVYLLASGLGVYVIISTYFIKPFHWFDYMLPDRFLLANITFGSTVAFFVVCYTRVFPKLLIKTYSNWTWYKESLMLLSGTITCAIVNVFLVYLFFKNEKADLDFLITMVIESIYNSIIPLSLIILINTIRLLKKKQFLYKAQLGSIDIPSDVLEKDIIKQKNIIIINDDKITFELNLNTLSSISTSLNYIEIIDNIPGKGINKRVIRYTISKLTTQLENHPFFFRSHRTTIVNLSKVTSYSGNYSKGFSLNLEGLDLPLPVAKVNSKAFMDRITMTQIKQPV